MMGLCSVMSNSTTYSRKKTSPTNRPCMPSGEGCTHVWSVSARYLGTGDQMTSQGCHATHGSKVIDVNVSGRSLCVCVCMYICMYVCMYVYIYIYIYIYCSKSLGPSSTHAHARTIKHTNLCMHDLSPCTYITNKHTRALTMTSTESPKSSDRLSARSSCP
jgi:hypothetical protein